MANVQINEVVAVTVASLTAEVARIDNEWDASYHELIHCTAQRDDYKAQVVAQAVEIADLKAQLLNITSVASALNHINRYEQSYPVQ